MGGRKINFVVTEENAGPFSFSLLKETVNLIVKLLR